MAEDITKQLENLDIRADERNSTDVCEETYNSEEDWEQLLDDSQSSEEEQPKVHKGVSSGSSGNKLDSRSSNKENELVWAEAEKHVDPADGITSILVENIPTAFKTNHLEQIFGVHDIDFKVKWRNDTTALLQFKDKESAKSVFLQHIVKGFYTIQPCTEKAVIQQRKKRPVTTDLVARRLIHGALGVKMDRQQRIAKDTQERAKIDSIKAQMEQRAKEERRRQREIDDAFDS
jgi:hypothetical protein